MTTKRVMDYKHVATEKLYVVVPTRATLGLAESHSITISAYLSATGE